MPRKDAGSGAQRFDGYYREIYKDRWDGLKAAMFEDSNPIELSSAFGESESVGCFETPYYMDMASILAANMLPVKAGDRVLDMCAAPGGKTLVLAAKLNGTGTLVSNDRSASRRSRLAKVVDTCLKPQAKSNIKVTGHDSSTWSLYEKDAYDCVLLDAPCSSERHVLNDSAELSIWSPSRPKRLAIQQFAMLAAALDAAVDGGYILYSTCSINPVENEKVIEKLERKRNGLFEEIPLAKMVEDIKEGVLTNTFNSLHVEELQHGSIVLPDNSNLCGPLYFCLLRKRAFQTGQSKGSDQNATKYEENYI